MSAHQTTEPLSPDCMAQCWLPNGEQLDGATVYVLAPPPGAPAGIGGERQVSLTVAAAAEAVMAVLTAAASSPLLGQVACASCLARPVQHSSIWCFDLAQPTGRSGLAAWLLAPRHAIVQTVAQLDAAGVYCLLFTSLPDSQARRLLQQHHQQHQQQRPWWRNLLSWLWPPVLACVAGGFTVVPLQGGGGAAGDKSESLLTCLLQADARGWLHPASPLAQQLVRPLLGSVVLIKQAAEAQARAQTPQQPKQPNTWHAWQRPQQQQCQQQHQQQARGSSSSAAPADGPSTDPCWWWRQPRGSSMAAPPAQDSSGAAGPARQQGSSRSLLSGLLSWLGARSPQAGAPHAAPEQPSGSAPEAAGLLQAAAGPGAAQQLVGLDEAGQPLAGCCKQAMWSPLHQPGCPQLFQVRGPSYLADRRKVPAGSAAFTLIAVDLVTTATPVQHIARYLPSVRQARAASCFVVNMLVPSGSRTLNLVMTWGSRRPLPGGRRSCDSGGQASANSGSRGARGQAGSEQCSNESTSSSTSRDADGASSSSCSESSRLRAFDNALRRFLAGGPAERSSMLKMIPHIQVGSWVLKQAVGQTPVIIGCKLEASYHTTPKYVEADIDVTTCKTAGFIVSSIQGITTSLVVDLAYLLEGQVAHELPEVLLGGVRFAGLDFAAAVPLDTSRGEVPLLLPA